MTSSVALLGAFADVVILLALVAAVASPRVSRVARPLIATFAFAWAWLLTAVFVALRAPGWTMFTGGAVIVVSIVVITVTVHLWTQGADGGDSGPGQRGDHGGGGPRRRGPDAPQHGGGGTDPSWWPEFERQLAFYVAKREWEKRPPAVLPPTTPTTSLRRRARRPAAGQPARPLPRRAMTPQGRRPGEGVAGGPQTVKPTR
jgi:hypothetical protein